MDYSFVFMSVIASGVFISDIVSYCHLPLYWLIYCLLIVSPFIFTARILRGVRIAARLDFRFSRETALAVRKLSATVLRLDRVSRRLLSIHEYVQLFWMMYWVFLVLQSTMVLGKASHGSQLHAGIWFRGSLIKIFVEAWSFGNTSAYSGRRQQTFISFLYPS